MLKRTRCLQEAEVKVLYLVILENWTSMKSNQGYMGLWSIALYSDSATVKISRLTHRNHEYYSRGNPICKALGVPVFWIVVNSVNPLWSHGASLFRSGICSKNPQRYINQLLSIIHSCAVLLDDFLFGHIILIYRIYTGCLEFSKRLQRKKILPWASARTKPPPKPDQVWRLKMPDSRFYTTTVFPSSSHIRCYL